MSLVHPMQLYLPLSPAPFRQLCLPYYPRRSECAPPEFGVGTAYAAAACCWGYFSRDSYFSTAATMFCQWSVAMPSRLMCALSFSFGTCGATARKYSNSRRSAAQLKLRVLCLASGSVHTTSHHPSYSFCLQSFCLRRRSGDVRVTIEHSDLSNPSYRRAGDINTFISRFEVSKKSCLLVGLFVSSLGCDNKVDRQV